MTYKVVILSARASNLVSCVHAIQDNEPLLPPEHIIVVDDGARAQAEAQLPGITWVQGVKPFIYARNVNLGIRAAGTDVILLNDDAQLLTPRGFTCLVDYVQGQSGLGLCSAGIRGIVGNANQRATQTVQFREERKMLAFVCVCLPKRVYDQVGLLDEQFDGYGFEDNDYCARVLAAGLRLGIWDGCVVDHSGTLASTFRTRPDLYKKFAHNQKLYQDKWRNPMNADARVDLLYLACNRLEFTRETFTTLVTNTHWRYVHELFVYDDGSQDGTREWLEENVKRVPAPTRFIRTNFGSPVSAMTNFIEASRAPILAKTDNDAMLPLGWLHASLAVMDRHPELTLLGIEAMYPHNDDLQAVRSYTPAQFISGLGLYRRSAFSASRPRAIRKWYGLEEWQVARGPAVKPGWITPALPVFLLDRIPFEPWTTYTENYIRHNWQRSWPKYDPACTLWQWRWPPSTASLSLAEHVNFLCVMRIKNEAQHIQEVLTQALRLCECALVFDDHSTDETVTICRSFGNRVTVISSPFEGLDEARDKNYLLQKIIDLNPDWVLWIDGDEVLEHSGPDSLRAAAQNGNGIAAYYLRVAYLWNDPQHVRIDGIFGQFKRPSFFRLRGQHASQLRFQVTGQGGNFHCGNVPQGLVGELRDLNVRLKHYGYMTREQRQAKYKWYTTIDPNNQAEDYYRHLAEIPGARHAPSSPEVIAWTE